MTNLLACPKCAAPLPAENLRGEGLVSCGACRTRVAVATFPAILAAPTEDAFGALILDETESACFYHATRQAIESCGRCGRFLCTMCTVPVGEQTLCPQCLASEVHGHLGFHRQHLRTDYIALGFAVMPLAIMLVGLFLLVVASPWIDTENTRGFGEFWGVLWSFIAFITIPLALGTSLFSKSLKEHPLRPGNRLRLTAAGLALAEIAFFLLVLYVSFADAA